jgi:hypothetical protein
LEHCPRKRFWRYHFDGLGIEGGDTLKVDARIGQWVHNGIERWLNGFQHSTLFAPALAEDCARNAADGFVDECKAIVEWDGLIEEQKFQIIEGGQIVKALVYAWCRVRGESLMVDYDILAIEQEMTVDFVTVIGGVAVRLMARPDIVARRKSDGAIFIRNLKTVRDPSTIWREQWALDMQTLSEPLAVDKWLFDSKYEASTCDGVSIDGLITGAVEEYPRGSGHRYHNTPLLYAWCKKGIANDAPFEVPDIWYTRYEWQCVEPHKMGNGHKCPGGRSHKLSGVTKESVEMRYAGGVIGWIDFLLANDRALVEEQLIELPPILRSPYQIERWKRQVLEREVTVDAAARWCGDSPTPDQALDTHFPMHTASGNCLRPGKCAFFDCCHGTAASDPYAAGFRRRVVNHPVEEMKNESAVDT